MRPKNYNKHIKYLSTENVIYNSALIPGVSLFSTDMLNELH